MKTLTIFLGLTLIIGAILLSTLYIQTAGSASSERQVMLQQNSLERLVNYPCKPGTEDYRYSGYVLCERRHDFTPPPDMHWDTPY